MAVEDLRVVQERFRREQIAGEITLFASLVEVSGTQWRYRRNGLLGRGRRGLVEFQRVAGELASRVWRCWSVGR